MANVGEMMCHLDCLVADDVGVKVLGSGVRGHEGKILKVEVELWGMNDAFKILE